MAGAQANPVAPSVVSGSASFDQVGKVLTVTNSTNAIINWQQFNIAAGETTRFVQPSASSAVMNRVLAADPSVIYGNLSSNGKVWLVNPAGILVGPGARIDVAGFVASTLNISNQDFLAGRMNLAAGAGGGNVVNQGAITTPLGGSVYLIGSNVSNEGIITTPQGETLLAAGNTVELIDSATPGVKVAITGAEGNATNLGEIFATAGRIGIAGVIVRNSGQLNASSVVQEGGRIFLRASKDAYVDGAGRIVTTGTSGGRVEVLGARVAVMDQARIDASGEAGGGKVLVGGDWQGSNPDVANSEISYFGPDAEIKANATKVGAGGTVVVWADNTTRAHGRIEARGGAEGGAGGMVETSGKQYLDVAAARVDTSAAAGATGAWLLDPAAITIYGGSGDGAADGVTAVSGSSAGSIWATDAGPTAVYQSEIEAQSATTSIILDATDSISTAGTFTNNRVTLASNSGLSLITRNGPSDGAAGIDLTSGGTNPSLEFKVQGTGNIHIQTGAYGQSLGAQAAPITVGKLTADYGQINLYGTGDITASGEISSLGFSGAGVTIQLASQLNGAPAAKVTTTGQVHASSGQVSLYGKDVEIGSGGLNAPNAMPYGGNYIGVGPDGAATQYGAILADKLTLSGEGGSYMLTHSGNDIGTLEVDVLASGNGTGRVDYYDSNSLTLAAARVSGDWLSISVGANLLVSTPINTSGTSDHHDGGDISLQAGGDIFVGDLNTSGYASGSGQGGHGGTVGINAGGNVEIGSIDARGGYSAAYGGHGGHVEIMGANIFGQGQGSGIDTSGGSDTAQEGNGGDITLSVPSGSISRLSLLATGGSVGKITVQATAGDLAVGGVSAPGTPIYVEAVHGAIAAYGAGPHVAADNMDIFLTARHGIGTTGTPLELASGGQGMPASVVFSNTVSGSVNLLANEDLSIESGINYGGGINLTSANGGIRLNSHVSTGGNVVAYGDIVYRADGFSILNTGGGNDKGKSITVGAGTSIRIAPYTPGTIILVDTNEWDTYGAFDGQFVLWAYGGGANYNVFDHINTPSLIIGGQDAVTVRVYDSEYSNTSGMPLIIANNYSNGGVDSLSFEAGYGSGAIGVFTDIDVQASGVTLNLQGSNQTAVLVYGADIGNPQGVLNITGEGNAAEYRGIRFENASANAEQITMSGTGGTVNLNNNQGVFFSNTDVKALTGISITGQGGGNGSGTSAGMNNQGVRIDASTMTVYGAGGMTITGYGGTGYSGSNTGIHLTNSAATAPQLTSYGGNITLLGQGGSAGYGGAYGGAYSHGISVASKTLISGYADASIHLTGYGGGSSTGHGIEIYGDGNTERTVISTHGVGDIKLFGDTDVWWGSGIVLGATTVSAANGDIDMLGSAGSDAGVGIQIDGESTVTVLSSDTAHGLTLTGYGGYGLFAKGISLGEYAYNAGVDLLSYGGDIVLAGLGGNEGEPGWERDGVSMGKATYGSSITGHNAAAVRLTGVAGTYGGISHGAGINLVNANLSGAGGVELTADIQWAGTTSIAAPGSDILIRPYSTGAVSAHYGAAAVTGWTVGNLLGGGLGDVSTGLLAALQPGYSSLTIGRDDYSGEISLPLYDLNASGEYGRLATHGGSLALYGGGAISASGSLDTSPSNAAYDAGSIGIYASGAVSVSAIYGAVVATSGVAGRGGDVSILASGDITVSSGIHTYSQVNGAGSAGDGGQVSMTSNAGSINVGQVSTHSSVDLGGYGGSGISGQGGAVSATAYGTVGLGGLNTLSYVVDNGVTAYGEAGFGQVELGGTVVSIGSPGKRSGRLGRAGAPILTTASSLDIWSDADVFVSNSGTLTYVNVSSRIDQCCWYATGGMVSLSNDGDIVTGYGGIVSASHLTVNATGQLTVSYGGRVLGADVVNGGTQMDIYAAGITVEYGGRISGGSNGTQARVDATTGTLTNYGGISGAVGNLLVTGASIYNGYGGTISVGDGQSLSVSTAGALTNYGGTMSAAINVGIGAGTFTNAYGGSLVSWGENGGGVYVNASGNIAVLGQLGFSGNWLTMVGDSIGFDATGAISTSSKPVSLTANSGDILVNEISTGLATASLTATQGAIVGYGGTPLHIAAETIYLTAATGIGTQATPLMVHESLSQMPSSLHFSNTGIGDVHIASDYALNVDEGFAAAGNIYLTSTGGQGIGTASEIRLLSEVGNVVAHGDIVYEADAFTIVGTGAQGNTISHGGTVSLVPHSAGSAVSLAAFDGYGAGLTLYEAQLEKFTTGKLVLGDTTGTSSVLIDGPNGVIVPSTIGSLKLATYGGITQTTFLGLSSGVGLDLYGGTIDLSNAQNYWQGNAGPLSITATDGTFAFHSAGPLVLGDIVAAGQGTLVAGGRVDQAYGATINVGNLLLSAYDGMTLGNDNNMIGQISALNHGSGDIGLASWGNVVLSSIVNYGGAVMVSSAYGAILGSGFIEAAGATTLASGESNVGVALLSAGEVAVGDVHAYGGAILINAANNYRIGTGSLNAGAAVGNSGTLAAQGTGIALRGGSVQVGGATTPYGAFVADAYSNVYAPYGSFVSTGTISAGGAVIDAASAQYGAHIAIRAFDVSLGGTLDGGNGLVSLTAANDRNVHVGYGGADFTISNAELVHVTAGKLLIQGGSVMVDGVAPADGAGIGHVVLHGGSGGVHFAGGASSFNALSAESATQLSVETDLTTTVGDMVLRNNTNGALEWNDDLHLGMQGPVALAVAGSATLGGLYGGVIKTQDGGQVNVTAANGVHIPIYAGANYFTGSWNIDAGSGALTTTGDLGSSNGSTTLVGQSIAVGGSLATSGALSVSSGSDIGQSGAWTAGGEIALSAHGNILLTHAGNSMTTLAAANASNAGGDIVIVNGYGGPLSLGAVSNAFGGIAIKTAGVLSASAPIEAAGALSNALDSGETGVGVALSAQGMNLSSGAPIHAYGGAVLLDAGMPTLATLGAITAYGGVTLLGTQAPAGTGIGLRSGSGIVVADMTVSGGYGAILADAGNGSFTGYGPMIATGTTSVGGMAGVGVGVTAGNGIDLHDQVQGGSGSVLMNAGLGAMSLHGNAQILSAFAGDAIQLGGASFANQGSHGGNALVASDTAGRWLVWASDPMAIYGGGLMHDFGQYDAHIGTTVASGSGNGFMYAYAPVIAPTLSGSFSKVYDGTAFAYGGSLAATGVYGDSVNLVASVLEYNSQHVGVANTVTASGLTVTALDGAGKPVYGYQATGATAAGDITPASLSIVGMTAASKIYDGTTTASLSSSGSLSGLVGNEALTLNSPVSGTFNSKDVLTANLVTASGYSIGDGSGAYGGLASNYQLAATSVTANASITPADLLVTATGGTRVYDGSAMAPVSYADNRVYGGDVFTVSGNASFADRHVGNGKSITITGLTLTGNDAGNYQLVSQSYSGAVGSITPLASVTWTGAAGNWSDAANWSGGALPNVGAVPDGSNVLAVSIPSGASVTYDAGVEVASSLDSLTSSGMLHMAAGGLSVSGDLNTAAYQQTGGVLNVGGNMTVTESFSKNGSAGAGGASGSLLAGGLVSITQLAGDLLFYNDQPITLGPVTVHAGNFYSDTIGAFTTTGVIQSLAGSIILAAHSPLTIGAAITASGGISLSAGASAGTGDHLVINGALSSTAGGNILLSAGDNIAQNANIATNGGSVFADALTGSVDMASGVGTSSGGGAIGYSAPAGSLLLANLNAGTGGVLLEAGGNIGSQTGAVISGGSAQIKATGNLNLNTQVQYMDVDVGGSFYISNGGTVITDTPASTTQAATTATQTALQEATQKSSSTSNEPVVPPSSSPTGTGTSGGLGSGSMVTGGSEGTFGSESSSPGTSSSGETSGSKTQESSQEAKTEGGSKGKSDEDKEKSEEKKETAAEEKKEEPKAAPKKVAQCA